MSIVRDDGSKTIFISYGRNEKVNKFVDKLSQVIEAEGWSTFVDREEVTAGDEWMDELSAALGRCKAVVAVLTPKYLNSKYCKMELVAGFNSGKVLFPVILREVPKYDETEHGSTIKMIIQQFQYTMFKSASFEEAAMNSLLKGIKKKCKERLLYYNPGVV